MKTQIIFTCARCGKEQTENLNCFTVRRFKYRNLIGKDTRGYKLDKELCDDCYRSLKIWLQNGNEYAILIDENKDLKNKITWLTEQRINLMSELKSVKNDFEHCQNFCPRNMPDYNEYMKGYDKWYEKKHKDDIQ